MFYAVIIHRYAILLSDVARIEIVGLACCQQFISCNLVLTTGVTRVDFVDYLQPSSCLQFSSKCIGCLGMTRTVYTPFNDTNALNQLSCSPKPTSANIFDKCAVCIPIIPVAIEDVSHSVIGSCM